MYYIVWLCMCVRVHTCMCVFVIRTTGWMTSLISLDLLSTLLYLLLSLCSERLTWMNWKRSPSLLAYDWNLKVHSSSRKKKREHWWWVWYLFLHFFSLQCGDYLGMLHALLKVSAHIRQSSLCGLLCHQYHPPYLLIILLFNSSHVPFRFRGKKLSCC